jgi:hypothetical protein
MTYDHCFSAALVRLHDERRYRVFADLERVAGRFPHAIWHSPDGCHSACNIGSDAILVQRLLRAD